MGGKMTKPGFKTYYEAIVFKSVLLLKKQINRIE